MYNYKIKMQYEGTRYNGWQKQGNTQDTIQNAVETAIFNAVGESVEVLASGRTDAGVHAKEQTANFKLNNKQNERILTEKINNALPSDIKILSCEEVNERFHARLNAVGKVYVYRLSSGKPDVFERRTILNIGENLDINSMKEAAALLVGEKDFRGFSSDKRKKKSTVRTIYFIDVMPKNDVIEIVFCGSGFLYNMVRIISGTLAEVGLGKRDINSVQTVLNTKDRKYAGATLPPKGLMLEKVFYDTEELYEYINGR